MHGAQVALANLTPCQQACYLIFRRGPNSPAARKGVLRQPVLQGDGLVGGVPGHPPPHHHPLGAQQVHVEAPCVQAEISLLHQDAKSHCSKKKGQTAFPIVFGRLSFFDNFITSISVMMSRIQFICFWNQF